MLALALAPADQAVGEREDAEQAEDHDIPAGEERPYEDQAEDDGRPHGDGEAGGAGLVGPGEDSFRGTDEAHRRRVGLLAQDRRLGHDLSRGLRGCCFEHGPSL